MNIKAGARKKGASRIPPLSNVDEGRVHAIAKATSKTEADVYWQKLKASNPGKIEKARLFDVSPSSLLGALL
jgi:hypothetical protein